MTRSSRVVLQPIGAVPEHVMGMLQDKLSHVFENWIISVSDTTLNPPKHCFDLQRGQFNSPEIISWLRFYFRNIVNAKILGIGDFSAYSGRLNFVFGQAELGRKIGVVYLAPLKEGILDDDPFLSASSKKVNEKDDYTGDSYGKELFCRRVFKEALHELGHCNGLAHCSKPECVMSFSNSIGDTDRKGDEICGLCNALLEQ